MNRATWKPIGPACLYGLLALSVLVLNSPSSVLADATSPAEVPMQQGFTAQSKPGSKAPRATAAFTPAKPGTEADRKAAKDRDAGKAKDK